MTSLALPDTSTSYRRTASSAPGLWSRTSLPMLPKDSSSKVSWEVQPLRRTLATTPGGSDAPPEIHTGTVPEGPGRSTRNALAPPPDLETGEVEAA